MEKRVKGEMAHGEKIKGRKQYMEKRVKEKNSTLRKE